MSRLTRDGTVETVSRDQILRHERGQGKFHFPCSADHEQDWQPYPVDPYYCYMCDHTQSPSRRRWLCLGESGLSSWRSATRQLNKPFCHDYDERGPPAVPGAELESLSKATGMMESRLGFDLICSISELRAV